MDKCYIYKHVSTKMQLEGYSLEAQEEKIRQQCKVWNLKIVSDYCDEGKSGKTFEGRNQFLKMTKIIFLLMVILLKRNKIYKSFNFHTFNIRYSYIFPISIWDFF